MKRLLLLFATIYGLSSFAQVESYVDKDHFVIKISGDTVYGKLKYTSGDDIKNKITVKTNDTLKYTFKASEIKYFRDGALEYVTFQPDLEEFYFIKIWQAGKYLSCYDWQVPFEITGGKVQYLPYIRRADDKSFVELDVHWTKHFADYVEDYTKLAEDVLKNKYKIEQLGDLVRMYNEWKEKQEK